jgi:phytoene/squalene synthetase
MGRLTGGSMDGTWQVSFPHMRTQPKDIAEAITLTSSKQTYFTVRLMVDRSLMKEAFRAYGYFRWMDDKIDRELSTTRERISFVSRQEEIMERCYRGLPGDSCCPEESMLVNLIDRDHDPDSKLQSYIRRMMALMEFDARRKGEMIGECELDWYSETLAVSVTDALHHFIGNHCRYPRSNYRTLAAQAAHVTHMLRDAVDDISNGYVNIPKEYLERHGLQADDFGSEPYREWVRRRVELAREMFRLGKSYIGSVENIRCRIVGYWYCARFKWVLDVIEQDGYVLKPQYQKPNDYLAMIRLAGLAVGSTVRIHGSARQAQ